MNQFSERNKAFAEKTILEKLKHERRNLPLKRQDNVARKAKKWDQEQKLQQLAESKDDMTIQAID